MFPVLLVNKWSIIICNLSENRQKQCCCCWWWINWNTLPLQIWNIIHPSAVTRFGMFRIHRRHYIEQLPLHGADFLPKIKVKQTNKKVPGSVWRLARLTVNTLVYSQRSSAKMSRVARECHRKWQTQDGTTAPRWRNMTDLGLASLAVHLAAGLLVPDWLRSPRHRWTTSCTHNEGFPEVRRSHDLGLVLWTPLYSRLRSGIIYTIHSEYMWRMWRWCRVNGCTGPTGQSRRTLLTRMTPVNQVRVGVCLIFNVSITDSFWKQKKTPTPSYSVFHVTSPVPWMFPFPESTNITTEQLTLIKTGRYLFVIHPAEWWRGFSSVYYWRKPFSNIVL